MKKDRLPRDAAASFKLPTTKPGNIKVMCSLPGRMEIYTSHETFKVQSPESIDPKRTNPHAMWVQVKTHDVGSASPFVARTLIMASQAVKQIAHPPPPQGDALLERMHAIKETLLQCAQAGLSYSNAVAAELAAFEASGYKLEPSARAYERFPSVPNLDGLVTGILLSARRVITEVCQLPTHFWPTSREHSALEHLLMKELVPLLGQDHRLVTYMQGFVDPTKRVLDLRNGQEHGSTSKGPRLQVRNFAMAPSGQVHLPVWQLGDEEPEDIGAHSGAIADFLLSFAEHIFVGCMDATLPEWPPMVFEVADPPDPECPMRYRLTVDMSRNVATCLRS